MRSIAIDPVRVRARHQWFIAYGDVLVQRLGGPAITFRDGLRHAVSETAGLPFERLHQNLIAAHLAGNLLYGRQFFDDAVAKLRRNGWLQQDIAPLAEIFLALAENEEVADRKAFASVGVNLLVWRMSVRIAAQIPIERLAQELADVWGDDDPSVLIEEAIASAGLPAPPQLQRDDVQARIDFLATDRGFQEVLQRRLAEYDEHAWTHPDLPHVIRPWVVASLIRAIDDADIAGFGEERVLARCAETRRAIAAWVRGCTAVEGLLLIPRGDQAA